MADLDCSRCLWNTKNNKNLANASIKIELNLSFKDVTQITKNSNKQNYIDIGSMNIVYREQFLDGTIVVVNRLTIWKSDMIENA